MNLIKRDDVTVTLFCEQEEISPRGNALDSGDPAVDKEVEDEILARLERHDVWAWCTVKIIVSFCLVDDIPTLQNTQYLGCCSYKDEDEFQAGGYYEDMINEGIDELNKKLASILHHAGWLGRLIT